MILLMVLSSDESNDNDYDEEGVILRNPFLIVDYVAESSTLI